MSAPTPAEMREILIDWYIAVDGQRYTGNSMIRNGVEHRMFAMAKQLYNSKPGTPGDEQT